MSIDEAIISLAQDAIANPVGVDSKTTLAVIGFLKLSRKLPVTIPYVKVGEGRVKFVLSGASGLKMKVVMTKRSFYIDGIECDSLRKVVDMLSAFEWNTIEGKAN